MRIKVGLTFCFLVFSKVCSAQVIEINGVVKAKSDVEGIHVINKTSKFYSTTNRKGGFTIKGKVNDTLVFSSVKYKLESLLITQEVVSDKYLVVELIVHVNRLNEVYIGNSLSGNLKDDIGNEKGKPDINFYDVGIPGYTGKPKTQNERRLFEADHGKILQLGVSKELEPELKINFHKLLNNISGRTKMLKNRVELDKKDALMYNLKAKFSNDLFNVYQLSKEKQMDYYYFCSEDENFVEISSSGNGLIILDFLKEKLYKYISIQKNND